MKVLAFPFFLRGGFISFILSALCTISVDAQDATSAKNENLTIIRKLYDAVNAKDLGYIKSLGAPSSEWLDVPFNFTSRGENAIIDPWKSWFDIFPDAACEVQSLVALGDYVIARGIGRGTQKGTFNSPAGLLQPSNKKIEVNFCDVYRLEKGKIIRADSYFDFYTVLRQLAPEKVR